MTEEELKAYLQGANDLRLSVWHELAPILKQGGYTDSTISVIFADVGLLREVTADNIEDIQHRASQDYYLRKLELENDSTKKTH